MIVTDSTSAPLRSTQAPAPWPAWASEGLGGGVLSTGSLAACEAFSPAVPALHAGLPCLDLIVKDLMSR